MKFLVKAALVAAVLGASAAANADTFDFSYTFADGQQVIGGSFDGTSTDGGQSISNITNLQVSFNGVAFTGGVSDSLVLNAWNGTTFVAPSSSTTIYANAALNNFSISDVDTSVDLGPSYEFSFVNNTTQGAAATAYNALSSDVFGDSPTGVGYQLDADFGNGTWTVTPVPVPAALPLLLSGLGLFGAARRRRAA